MTLAARARALSALLVAVIAAVMLSTVLDYGMTGDEGVQHRYARRVLHWYATLGADRSARGVHHLGGAGARPTGRRGRLSPSLADRPKRPIHDGTGRLVTTGREAGQPDRVA